jgi:hypothetical protein
VSKCVQLHEKKKKKKLNNLRWVAIGISSMFVFKIQATSSRSEEGDNNKIK